VASFAGDNEVFAMFAIFEDGSHQYRVRTGDTIKIDFRDSARPGDALLFDRVLAAATETHSAIGRPVVSGASVRAEVVEEEVRGPKLEIGKFRRRKLHIRHNGHVQRYTAVRITGITVPELDASGQPA
jgi:large subunit ribosomal protein L21